MSSTRIQEATLVKMLCQFLSEEGYHVRTEVPNMGQSIDIAATKNRWFTAIEVKVHDWRRALKQCRAHELVADFICVAVGTRAISSQLRDAASHRGYGVIHIDVEGNNCYWATKPRRNLLFWHAQRKCLSANLKDIEYVK